MVKSLITSSCSLLHMHLAKVSNRGCLGSSVLYVNVSAFEIHNDDTVLWYQSAIVPNRASIIVVSGNRLPQKLRSLCLMGQYGLE